MLATSLLSLVLLLLAGVLLDSHRRDWRSANAKAAKSGESGADFRFARSRYRRRNVATATIAVVGVLIALWPVTPREPFWVVAYGGTVSALAGLIFVLGLSDAWSSAAHYRAESRERLAQHANKLAKLLEEQRSGRDDSADAEASRA